MNFCKKVVVSVGVLTLGCFGASALEVKMESLAGEGV